MAGNRFKRPDDTELLRIYKNFKGNIYLYLARIHAEATLAEAARSTGISYQTYSRIENENCYPRQENRRRICEYFTSVYKTDISEELLFPQETDDVLSESENIYSIDLTVEMNGKTKEQNRIEGIEQTFERAFASIEEREATALRMKFYDELTLQEVGDFLNVSRESIRQLQNKGIRKIRHPYRRAMFTDCRPDMVGEDKRYLR